MLITDAGFALFGTPDTEPPEAQTIASAMSEVKPPHFPNTRTGTTLRYKQHLHHLGHFLLLQQRYLQHEFHANLSLGLL
jgi:hypothetical protein